MKSGYWITLGQSILCGERQRSPSDMGAHRAFWKRLWMLEILNKIKLFLWGPYMRKVIHSPLCSKCGREGESTMHALWQC